MGRWLWRGTLAIVALLVLLGAAPTVRAFTLACDGSLDGLRYLRNVRSQIAEATAPPPTPTPLAPTATPSPAAATASATVTVTPTATLPPTATVTLTPTAILPATPPPEPIPPAAYVWLREAAGKIAVGAITGFVHVKESDVVAYPAHVAVAYVLDGAGCGEDAVRIQWLKAALHASRAGQPEQIARALDARTTDPDGRAQLRGVVQVWTERQPWSGPMRRVRDALDALST